MILSLTKGRGKYTEGRKKRERGNGQEDKRQKQIRKRGTGETTGEKKMKERGDIVGPFFVSLYFFLSFFVFSSFSPLFFTTCFFVLNSPLPSSSFPPPPFPISSQKEKKASVNDRHTFPLPALRTDRRAWRERRGGIQSAPAAPRISPPWSPPPFPTKKMPRCTDQRQNKQTTRQKKRHSMTSSPLLFLFLSSFFFILFLPLRLVLFSLFFYCVLLSYFFSLSLSLSTCVFPFTFPFAHNGEAHKKKAAKKKTQCPGLPNSQFTHTRTRTPSFATLPCAERPAKKKEEKI